MHSQETLSLLLTISPN